jgi:hypothetical protein
VLSQKEIRPIPLDILGNTRSTPPDLGAYQNKSFLNKRALSDSELNSKSVIIKN